MFAARFAAVTAATLLTGAAIAALTTGLPFQTESQKVKQHEVITKGVGQWAGTVTAFNTGSSEPSVTRCVETVKAIGDLWTVSEFTSSVQGAPFVGSSILGFDVTKQRFVATWVDSMTTHMTPMEGRWDGVKNAIVLDYEMKDPATGEFKDARMITNLSGDTYTSNFYEVNADGETLTMTIEMKRQKAVEASAPKDADSDAIKDAKDAVEDAADAADDAKDGLKRDGK